MACQKQTLGRNHSARAKKSVPKSGRVELISSIKIIEGQGRGGHYYFFIEWLTKKVTQQECALLASEVTVRPRKRTVNPTLPSDNNQTQIRVRFF